LVLNEHQAPSGFVLDDTDWQLLAIEADMGYVPRAAVDEAMVAADRLFDDPTADVGMLRLAGRAMVALVRCYATDTRQG
jgi:hypothetical protein